MSTTNGKYKLSIEHRITRLEGQVNEICNDVTEIKSNHLPHIQAAIERLDSRIWWILGTVVLGFVVSIFFTLHG